DELKNLRFHEILLEPYSDTSYIAKDFADIFYILKKDWPALQGNFDYPDNNFTVQAPDKPSALGQSASKPLFSLKPYIPIDLGKNACADILCITLNIIQNPLPDDNPPIQKQDSRIFETIELINSYLKKLTSTNVALRCVNRQTFGSRFYN